MRGGGGGFFSRQIEGGDMDGGGEFSPPSHPLRSLSLKSFVGFFLLPSFFLLSSFGSKLLRQEEEEEGREKKRCLAYLDDGDDSTLLRSRCRFGGESFSLIKRPGRAANAVRTF